MRIYFKTYSLFLVIFILSIYSCNVKKQPVNAIQNENEVNDSIVYGFINYLIEHTELITNIKSNITSDKVLEMPFPFYFKNDSIALTKLSVLNSEDIQFIFSQKIQFQTFDIDPKKIHNRKVISPDSIFNFNSYSTISYPLFNIDKTIAIIRVSYSDCSLCGIGGVYAYQKRHSEWFLIKELQGWIS